MTYSGSFPRLRRLPAVAPFALLALLAACSSEPPRQGLQVTTSSDLGRPLLPPGAVDTQRDRQRLQAEAIQQQRQPPQLHAIRTPARANAGTQAAASNPLGNQPVKLNFVDADIQAVVRGLSRATGHEFLVDPRVKGQLTLVAETEVPAARAYDMLLAALRMQGFTVVDVGGVSQVVPEADAKLLAGPVYGADKPATGGMITRTFRLQYENAVNLIPVLRPMVASNNPINAYPGNNTIVVTDYSDNLDRVATVIAGIDTPGALDTDVVQVRNGIASDIATLVTQLLESQGAADPTQKISVVGDPRSNTVIIRAGSPERTDIARQLIYKLDNAQAGAGNFHVVYLRNAQAGKLAATLRGMLTGERDSENGGDNARSILNGSNNAASTQGGTGTSSSNSSTGTSSGLSTSGSKSYGLGASQAGQGANGQGSTENLAFSANGVTVQADATTNTLLISAPDPMYRSLREVIDLLDQRRAQVVIESLIVEVGEDQANEFGVQWQAGNLAGSGGFGGAKLGGSGLATSASSTLDALPAGLSLGVVRGTVTLPGIGAVTDLKVLARALESKSGTNVLSTPNLLTLDNELASIFVGQTIPFVSGSYVTTGSSGSSNPFQTITREEVGLKLNVRPQISEGGTVKLDIYQEVSSVDSTANNTAGTVTNKRAIDTSILLDDGQIMVLGGLLQDSFTQTADAIPGLSRIPVLGALFRHDRRATAKTNLMVFLRPYIIRDPDMGRNITLNRYNFIRNAQGAVQPSHNWALPDDINAAQLPDDRQAMPGALPSGAGLPANVTPRAAIRAVPQ
ncbi:type II secretion system secretin GspD [Pseudomonas huanghezhanensis]|uniref:type II secretion system secretin GspD n=1 Tax=Pseudomonas huanghezhanensis TaxID=3002903 RepID=UPI0022859011|nr:type II secretion system secretin GspD [Pseudomonas sp. BSw22131]